MLRLCLHRPSDYPPHDRSPGLHIHIIHRPRGRPDERTRHAFNANIIHGAATYDDGGPTNVVTALAEGLVGDDRRPHDSTSGRSVHGLLLRRRCHIVDCWPLIDRLWLLLLSECGYPHLGLPIGIIRHRSWGGKRHSNQCYNIPPPRSALAARELR